MNDTGSFVAAVLRELAASTAVILAAWGALGGATNALTTKMRLRDALRHILLGGLIAAGMGSLSMMLNAKGDGNTLQMANRLWGEQDFRFSPHLLATHRANV